MSSALPLQLTLWCEWWNVEEKYETQPRSSRSASFTQILGALTVTVRCAQTNDNMLHSNNDSIIRNWFRVTLEYINRGPYLIPDQTQNENCKKKMLNDTTFSNLRSKCAWRVVEYVKQNLKIAGKTYQVTKFLQNLF